MSLIDFLLELLLGVGSSGVHSMLGEPTAPAELPRRVASPPLPARPRVDPAPKAQYVGPRVAVPGASECQVCGDALKGGLVACPACATLCHERCWDYARGCSTYGCEARG